MTSAEKTARLLTILGQEPYEFGVTELGRMIECTKSGTYKLLTALLQEGLVSQTNERKYSLGLTVYQLGQCYKDNDGFVRFARPFVNKLRDLTEENSSFSILHNGKPMRVWQVSGRQAVRLVGAIGEPRPFYVGSISKLLAAYMDPAEIRRRLESEELKPYTENTITDPSKLLLEFEIIRQQGYAISDGEYEPETCGIAAPVRNSDGKVWGALSISVPKTRMNTEAKEKFIKIVCDVADEMTAAGTCGNRTARTIANPS